MLSIWGAHPEYSLLRTILFHVANLVYGVSLLVLFGLTGGSLLLLVICTLLGSTRAVRVLVAQLWRIELALHSLCREEASRSPSSPHAPRDGSSPSIPSAMEEGCARENGHGNCSGNKRPARTAYSARGNEVTLCVMACSLLYFFLVKSIVSIMFSAIPLAFWTGALLQLVPADESSGLDGTGLVATSQATRVFAGLACAFFAHQIGVFAAQSCIKLSDLVGGGLFGNATPPAAPSSAATPLLHGNSAYSLPRYGSTQRAHPSSVSLSASVDLGRRSEGRNAPPGHLPYPPPPPPPPPVPPIPPMPHHMASMNGMGHVPPMAIPSRNYEQAYGRSGMDESEIHMCCLKVIVRRDRNQRNRQQQDRNASQWRPRHQPHGWSEPTDQYAQAMPDQIPYFVRDDSNTSSQSHDSNSKLRLQKTWSSEKPVTSTWNDNKTNLKLPQPTAPFEDAVLGQGQPCLRSPFALKRSNSSGALIVGPLQVPSEHTVDFDRAAHNNMLEVLDLGPSAPPLLSPSAVCPAFASGRIPVARPAMSSLSPSTGHSYFGNRVGLESMDGEWSMSEARMELEKMRVELERAKILHEREKIKRERARIASIKRSSELSLQGAMHSSDDGEEKVSAVEKNDTQLIDVKVRPSSSSVSSTGSLAQNLRAMSLSKQSEPMAVRSVPRRVKTGTQKIKHDLDDDDAVFPHADNRELTTSTQFQTAHSYDPRDLEIRERYSQSWKNQAYGELVATQPYMGNSFGASPSEIITCLDSSPTYRGPATSYVNDGYSGFSVDYEPFGEDVNYDTLSPTYSATVDASEFIPDELKQVYRSIEHSGNDRTHLDEFYDSPLRRDKVHFDAFAPPQVHPSPKPFRFTVWAFMLNQRDEMKERAESENPESKRISVDAKLDVRRGALVHITLEAPTGFRVLNGATQGFPWEGKISSISYDVECTEDAAFGPVLFKASIVVGAEVAILRAYVSVSPKPLDPSEYELRMLDSEMHVMEKAFEEIPFQELKLKQIVGSGYFGDAYLATYNGEDVVVKTIRASEFGETNDQIVKEFRHEAAMLSMFGHHPCVVPFLGASSDTRFPLSLVTKYLPHGSLEANLKLPDANDRLPTLRKTRMLKDAAAGLLNIHEGGFIHRDIAARNCLVDDDYRVKICDFGLCRRVDAYSMCMKTDLVGPIKYMAPESLGPAHSFSFKSDTYMFGVLMWETYTMSPPFSSMSAMEAMMRITRGERLPVPTDLPPALQNLMESCFRDAPDDRPTMDDILYALTDATDPKSVAKSAWAGESISKMNQASGISSSSQLSPSLNGLDIGELEVGSHSSRVFTPSSIWV